MKILVIYDSKTGNTEKLAHAVAEGIKEAGDDSDVMKVGQPFPISSVLSYSALVVGSPAIYADATHEMTEFLKHLKDYMRETKVDVHGRKAWIFGSYGYDGAWLLEKKLKDYLADIGYSVHPETCMKLDSEIKVHADEVLAGCKTWGGQLSKSLRQSSKP